MQKMAEAEELEAIERERARRRKAEAGKANLPTVSAGNISLTHKERSRVWKYFHTLKVKAVNPGFVRPLLKGGLIHFRRFAKNGLS